MKSIYRCAGVCLFLLLVRLPAQTHATTKFLSAQSSVEDDDPKVILEVGSATNWNTSGGSASFAPNLAAETTPIEHWLELEAGVSPFYTRNSTEWDTDLLFKKPWTLSSRAEFMLGIGPQWVYSKQGGRTSNTLAGEIAADFMFWPSGRNRFGWFLEPSYDYSFATSNEQSIGITAGLLIGIGRRHKR